MIRLKSIVLLVLVTLSFNALATATSIPDNGRFQVLQSSLTAKVTIKLDKYNGSSWRLVTNNKGEWAWKEISRSKHLLDTKRNKDKVNYMIYTSGLDADFTMMTNINTGATWYLTKKPGGTFWVAFY